MVEGAVTFDYCDYIFDPGNASGVTVAVANLGTGGSALVAQFKQSKALSRQSSARAMRADYRRAK